jgi:hypothetical protein
MSSSKIANITAIFWPLVEAIALMPYEHLTQTRFYEIMCDCVANHTPFRLAVCGRDLFHEDVNSLFYGTRDILRNLGADAETAVLDAAIRKIEQVIIMQDMCDQMSGVHIQAHEAADITYLNSLLDNLCIA